MHDTPVSSHHPTSRVRSENAADFGCIELERLYTCFPPHARRSADEATLMPPWLPYALVGVGGCLGSIARFAAARYIGGLVDTRFPLGTFVINLTASFLLGVVGSIVAARVSPTSEAVRVAIGIGFIGGYSTFSTLEYETHNLLETGELLMAVGNALGSLAAGMLAVRLGVLVGRWWIA